MSDPGHNLVSLLYSVKGSVETYFAKVEEASLVSMEDRLQYAEQILRTAYSQTEKSLVITKRLRLLAAGKRTLPLDKVCLSKLWDRIRDTLQEKNPQHQVEFICAIPENFPKIKSRIDELYEALYVIAQNAIEAMHGNGKLIIRAQVGFSAEQGTLASIVISDTGPGVPYENLKCLFKPFYSTKDAGEGNGLGLCLVRELIERNKGEISATSFYGQGTTFSIKIPLVEVQIQSA